MGAILTLLGAGASAVFFWDKPLDFLTKCLSYLFFALLLLAWAESVYLSAVKKFKGLLLSYLAGVLLAISLAWVFLAWEILPAEQSGLLAVDVGMTLVVLLFLLNISLRNLVSVYMFLSFVALKMMPVD
jgi:uncharacterized membrane protein